MDKFLTSSNKNQNEATRIIPAASPSSNPVEDLSIIGRDERSLSSQVLDTVGSIGIRSEEAVGAITGKRSRRNPPTFSPDNILSLTARVPISPSIYLSLKEPTSGPQYSAAERERATIPLLPAMNRNANQFQQSKDYEAFVEKYGNSTQQEILLSKYNKDDIVLNRMLDDKFKVRVLHCICCKQILPR